MKGRRRPLTMNPAFAAAHGIMSGDTIATNGKSTHGNSFETVLQRAKDTGKLVASNCRWIKAQQPLPNELFEFPFGLCRYTEETFTVVDFSDNPELQDSHLDDRILRYRSLRSLRFRNCGIRLPPDVFSLSSLENLTVLDLSGNRLDQTVDVGILLCSPHGVSPLTELNLSNNRIRELIATLPKSEEVCDASRNENQAVVSLPNLRSLDISYNPPLERLLETSDGNKIHVGLSCENLRIFRYHHNPNLCCAEDGLPSFLRSTEASLEVLEASHNPKMATLGQCQIDLSGYSNLQTVSLAMNKIETVPCLSHSIKTLDLRSNKLKSLQGMFPTTATMESSSSSELVDLILADNYITKLDPLFVTYDLPSLQRLDASSNKITSLPYQLGFLTNLSTLNISGNPVVTKFSSSVMSNNNPKALLEILRKRAPVGNSNTNSSSSVGGRKTSSQGSSPRSNLLAMALSTKGRTTLDLAGKIPRNTYNGRDNVLEELVRELGLNSAIGQGITGSICLDSNRLESLPEEFLSSCLPNVQTISLTNNRLAELPALWMNAPPSMLKRLQLGTNILTTESLKQAGWFQPSGGSQWSLRSLTHLDLSSNKLTSFPIDTSSDINCFPALEVLSISNNKLQTTEDWKRLPESLNILDLSENSIEDAEALAILLVGDCPNLQRLSLMRNNLRRIPTTLGLLSQESGTMTSLKLQGNPQRSVRSHILEKPCEELMEYLANRLTAEQRNTASKTIQERRRWQQQSKDEYQRSPHQDKSSISPSTIGSARSIQAHPLCKSTATDSGSLGITMETSLSSTVTNETQLGADSSQKVNNINIGDDEGRFIDQDEKDQNSVDMAVLRELQRSVEDLKTQLNNLSLTQAKKYAIKKALAMERSKLIREERRLGLRK